MIINHNLNAMNAHRNMGMNTNAAGKSMEKLSSGLRINRAGDDAAGLAISEKMRGQIKGLDQASRNAEDGISMIQTAEGALNETHNILQRMRELSVQAANDTNTEQDRTQIQKEINQLTEEVDRIANNTEFNTQKLLNGNKAGQPTAATAPDGTKVGDVKTPGTAGTIDIVLDNSELVDGAKVAIDGKTYEVTGADGAGLADAINNDKESKFTAAYDKTAGKLTLTYKEKVDTDAASTDISGSFNVSVSKANGQGAGTVNSVEVGTQGVADVLYTDAEVNGIEGKVNLQVGANKGQNMTLEIQDMRADALKISNGNKAGERGLDISTHEKANEAIQAFDDALNKVSTERAKLGSVQNRLEYTTTNLDNTSENLQAAESRIRDVDMAKEMMTFSKNNILQQAAQSMLAQANQQPQGVLQLLQ